MTEKGQEMSTEALVHDGQASEPDKIALRKLIVANLGLADKLLTRLNSADRLPENLPEELTDLIIYRVVDEDGASFYKSIDIELFYQKLREGEVDLSEYFIRDKRAHTQTLPYMKFSPSRKLIRKMNRVNLADEEKLTYNNFITKIKKEGADVKKLAQQKKFFVESGEGFGLDLSARRRILSVEVDCNEENIKIFNGLKARSAEKIARDTERRIQIALDKNLEKARRKYPVIEGQPTEKLLQVLDRMHRLAKVVKESEIRDEMELLGKLVKINGEALANPVTGETIIDALTGEARRKVTLRFPQIFEFNQTMNRGHFTSLAVLMANKREKKES